MKTKILIISFCMGVGAMQSCTHHLFVSDDKFVRTQVGYLLFFEKTINPSDTGIIEDEYMDKLKSSDDVRTLFLKTVIDTSLSKVQIIEEIKKSKNAIEFGEFCERKDLLMNLSDTLLSTQSGVFYFIPAKLSFINIHNRNSFHKAKIAFGNETIELKISDASFQLINVTPIFNQQQYEVVKERSLMQKRMPPPY